MFCFLVVAGVTPLTGSPTAISNLPRQVDSICDLPMVWDRSAPRPILPAHHHRAGLVHCRLLSRHLPAELVPRILAA